VEKIVFVFGRKDGLTPEEFRGHYLEVHAPLALRSMRTAHRYVVNLPDVDAGRDNTQAPPPFDAITELTVESAGDFFNPAVAFVSEEAGNAMLADHASFIGDMHAYLVEERVVKEYDRTWGAGERSPGVKYVSLIRRAPGLTREQMDEHWRERHVPIALEHHGGMWKYVQNVVREPLTPDAPEIDGVAEMHFPTLEDFQERFFTPPESKDFVLEDASRFLELSGLRYPLGEYVQLG
jgi:uncharacterized protein (TIGR02118 family)